MHQLKSWVDSIGPDSVRDQAKLSLLGLSTQVNQAKDAATIMFNQTSCNAETMTETLQAYITPIVESLLHPKPNQEEERSQNGTIANGPQTGVTPAKLVALTPNPSQTGIPRTGMAPSQMEPAPSQMEPKSELAPSQMEPKTALAHLQMLLKSALAPSQMAAHPNSQ
ncbi:hypothetical protein (Partial), partial [Seminavis robusta]|eukprot:Sro974_g226730.1 n/a (166) ;mRNA; f:40543-41041